MSRRFDPVWFRVVGVRDVPVVFLEELDRRCLLSATPEVVSVVADNRGDVSIRFNAALKATTLTTHSVLMYTAGKDKKLGTADDVPVKVALTYTASSDLLRILRVGSGQHGVPRRPDHGRPRHERPDPPRRHQACQQGDRLLVRGNGRQLDDRSDRHHHDQLRNDRRKAV